MAIIKHGTLILDSGRQIRLGGDGLCINNSLQIGTGFSDDFFAYNKWNIHDKGLLPVANPFNLNMEELHEIADYHIQLWTTLKGTITQLGVENPDIFRMDNVEVIGAFISMVKEGIKRNPAFVHDWLKEISELERSIKRDN